VSLSFTAGLEPVSLWLLGEPFRTEPVEQPRPRDRSPFGLAFTAWRRRRGLSLERAGALLGVAEETARTWGFYAFPARRSWPALAANGIDPAPFYRQPVRARKRPEAERLAMGRAITAWLDSVGAGVDVGVEIDVTDQTLRNWRAGKCTPTSTHLRAMQALGFVAPSEAA
jgi:hypothetical protein